MNSTSSTMSFGHPEVDVTTCHLKAGQPCRLLGSGPLELRYVRSGRALWQAGNRSQEVRAGDILISSNQLTEHYTVEQGPGLRMDILSIPVSHRVGLENTSPPWNPPRVLRRSRLASECASAMRDCLYEKTQGHPGWQDYVSARTRILLVHLYRFVLLRRHNPAKPSPRRDLGRIRVSAYVRKLDDTFHTAETMENVAEALHMSPRHFSQLFRAITGSTWLKYLHALRILKAKSLLAAKEDSIDLIAYQAGFQDATTFHRVFKNAVGTTPTEWRIRLRSQVASKKPSPTIAAFPAGT